MIDDDTLPDRINDLLLIKLLDRTRGARVPGATLELHPRRAQGKEVQAGPVLS
jgi:hypothetical protein